MSTSLALSRGFLKSRKDSTNIVPAKIAKVLFSGRSSLYVILVEKAEKSRSIIIHKRWGPDRGANADWFVKEQGDMVDIIETGFISKKVVSTCVEFIKAKEKLGKLGNDVWRILPS